MLEKARLSLCLANSYSSVSTHGSPPLLREDFWSGPCGVSPRSPFQDPAPSFSRLPGGLEANTHRGVFLGAAFVHCLAQQRKGGMGYEDPHPSPSFRAPRKRRLYPRAPWERLRPLRWPKRHFLPLPVLLSSPALGCWSRECPEKLL